MEPTAAFDILRIFRSSLYECFGLRADALFELTDAILSAGALPSPVHLSLQPSHRRGWGSLYAAIDRGSMDVEALRGLLSRHPLCGAEPPVYAVDQSVWSRCDAEASPERGFYYHPSRHSAGKPIVAGWSYQWIAQLGFARESWVAPMDVARVHPEQNPNTVAVSQIEALVGQLPEQSHTPLFVFDAGYDPVQLQKGLSGCRAQILVRLRAGRCFYADPPKRSARAPGKNGRPRRHGAKLDCSDPSTWPAPTAEHRCEDGRYGQVRVRSWSGLHAKTQNHPGHGTRGPRPIERGTLVLVEVSRLPQRTRKPQVLWMWWNGSEELDLDLLWRAYVRRFDLEHTFRFLKQNLGWTTPRFRNPKQADLWSWIIVAAYTQLRLARPYVSDRRLPWERSSPIRGPTPCRVARGFSLVLVALGTPARAPKPCGRSPGRPKGSRSGRAKRYPAIKKAA